MAEPGHNRISATVWRWNEHDPAPDRSTSTRKRATIQFAVMAVVAGLLALKFRHMAAVVGTVAVLLLLIGWLWPRGFLSIDRAMKAFGRGVGTVLTWVLLVPFFYLVFVPGHFFLRLRGKDPLHRDFPPRTSSSWMPYRQREGVEHYRKQYK